SKMMMVPLAFAILLMSCTGTTSTSISNLPFNFVLRYGVGPGLNNEIDTFQGTYTRWLTATNHISVDLMLTPSERDRILKAMKDIEFFDYSVPFLPDQNLRGIYPHQTFHFRVEYASHIKYLDWEAFTNTGSSEVSQLNGLIQLILSIVESKKQVSALP